MSFQYANNGTGRSPQYNKNGNFYPLMEDDHQFTEFAKTLADRLHHALPSSLSRGIQAIIASVNHSANTAHNALAGPELLHWLHTTQAKELGLALTDKGFNQTQRNISVCELDGRVLGATRANLSPKYYPIFDNMENEASKAADAHAAAQKAAQAVKPDEGVTPTLPVGNIGQYFSRAVYVIQCLYEHFAPRGATGVAFLIVNTIHELQAMMSATSENKAPSHISHQLARISASCDNIGTSTMTIGQLCGIVAAATLASSEGSLSETGNRLLSGLATSSNLKDTVLDIADVNAAVHQRRQVLEHASHAMQGSANQTPVANGNTSSTNQSRAYNGTTANNTDRPPKPTHAPDTGTEWAWGAISKTWYQKKVTLPRPSTPSPAAALHATEEELWEAASEAHQFGLSTFIVKDNAYKVVDGKIQQLVE